MATTSDFENWLGNLQETDIEGAHNLYESVTGRTEMGGFSCSENNGRLFVKSDFNDDTLMLASEKAKEAFLKKLDNDYGGDFGWVGGNYEFKRSMEKDD